MMNEGIVKKITNILLRPFKENFLFLIVLCALTICGHALGCFTLKHEMNLNAAIVTAMHCVCISYIITLFIGLIRQKAVKKTLQTIFILIAAIDFAITFYCSFYLHSVFDEDIALLILETDPSEAKEFFTSMVPMWVIAAVAGVFLFFILIWQIIKRLNLRLNLGKKASLVAMGIITICIIVNLCKWGIWKYGPIGPFYEFTQHENPSDLRSYFSHPKLTFDDKEELPTNVVLIIGESFGRSHSSIYGYNKLTNPQLAQLKDNSLLFSFDSINSPAHSTVQSLRYTLSTFDRSNEKGKKWYEFISIMELMNECGFDSYWFGNQGRVGKHNGTTRIYAQACDHQWFLKDDNTVDQYDIVLVDSSYQFIKQICHKNHNFIIYHMKGSHFDYSVRYPKEFAQFSENDYPTDPKNHRKILSSYDNSILYNDYIVNKIIDSFKDSEAIIIYLSDHGQVMYRNSKDPDYYAHGREEDPDDYALGIDIPFFIYATPLFQQKHPDTMQRIKYRQDHPKAWNSDDLPYFIMDLIGVQEINGEGVQSKSILN